MGGVFEDGFGILEVHFLCEMVHSTSPFLYSRGASREFQGDEVMRLRCPHSFLWCFSCK